MDKSERKRSGEFCASVWLSRLIIAAALLFLVTFIGHAIGACFFPFQTEYGEGATIAMVQNYGQTGHFYGNPEGFPWRLTPYTPCYIWLCSVLSGNTLGWGVGRALSVLSALGLLVILVWHVENTTAAPRIKLLGLSVGSWSLVALLCSDAIFFNWSAFYRVDLLGLALSLAGLIFSYHALLMPVYQQLTAQRATLESSAACASPNSPRLRCFCGAAVLFALAVYTKQSFVAAPLAVAWALLGRRRREGWIFLGFLTLVLLLPAVWLEQRSAGWFSTIAIGYSAMYWQLNQFLTYFASFLLYHAISLILLLVALCYSLLGLRARTSSIKFEPLAGCWPPVWSGLWLRYALLSLLCIFGLGRYGADVNYTLEFLVASAVVLAAWSNWATASYVKSSHNGECWRNFVLCLVLLQASLAGPTMEWVSLVTPLDSWRYELLPLWCKHRVSYQLSTTKMVRQSFQVADQALKEQVPNSALNLTELRARYPIICENMGDYVVGGYTCCLGDSALYTGLAALGKWEEGSFLRALAQQQFALVVINADTAYMRFTPGFFQVLNKSYSIKTIIGNEIFYLPNKKGGSRRASPE